jgi:hypothetical protein
MDGERAASAEHLTITARSRADAECIARQLRAFAPALGQAERTWTVTIGQGSSLVEVLSALETCLGANEIGSVVLGVDGRSYVMEPALH